MTDWLLFAFVVPFAALAWLVLRLRREVAELREKVAWLLLDAGLEYAWLPKREDA